MRKPKFYPKRAKNSGQVKDKHAPDLFLKKITDFKKKRRFRKFMVVPQVFLKGRGKRAFDAIVDSLEDFRIHLGMAASPFYKLASEFILVPSGRKYYPLKMIFVEEENQASEEFLDRIFDIMTWISDLTGKDFNNDKAVRLVMDFAKELSKRRISIDEASLMKQFRFKDWYCIAAIKEAGTKKGWSEVELLERIRIFYKRKIKKVTVEMVLGDLTHGELDKIDLEANNKKGKKKKVKSYVDVIENDDEFKEWKAGITE